MSKQNALVFLYLDNQPNPIAELQTPVVFKLDTTKMVDGEHQLKIISKSGTKEGLEIIKFTVKNGPVIHLEGLENNENVSGVLPLMLNSYDTNRSESFIIKGSENPRTVPVWVWILILVFFAWAVFYAVSNFSLKISS